MTSVAPHTEVASKPNAGNRLSGRAKKSGARLKRVELAYIRGMSALREKDYSRAHHLLSGYLKLLKQRDIETEVVVRTLELSLAIQRKIDMLSADISGEQPG